MLEVLGNVVWCKLLSIIYSFVKRKLIWMYIRLEGMMMMMNEVPLVQDTQQ